MGEDDGQGQGGTPPAGLDRAALTPVVRRALGSATASVGAWEARPLGPTFNPVTGGLFRVAGTARGAGPPAPWSLVLKVCRHSGAAAELDPRAGRYWKREFLAYASGLLAALPPGLRAPRCYGAEARPDGTAWLWLEELTDAYGAPRAPWPLERYAAAARAAGRLNGAYLAGRPLPAVPWLSADLARESVEWLGAPLARLPELAGHPLVRRQWPDAATADRVVRLWREREAFFAALARLPQTLCHLDLFRPNLFALPGPDGGGESGETAAVDWAFLGTAAVGEELAPLVGASPVLADADPARVRELGETAFAGYLAGLRDAGRGGPAAPAHPRAPRGDGPDQRRPRALLLRGAQQWGRGACGRCNGVGVSDDRGSPQGAWDGPPYGEVGVLATDGVFVEGSVAAAWATIGGAC